MSTLMLCIPTEGGAPVTPTCTGGKLDVNATVSISGGATEAKQDTQIAKLAGGLPAAFTGGGGLKVGVVDALPAGTAVIGCAVPTNTSGAVLFPTAAALSNAAAANPTTTKIGAVVMGREENGDTLRRIRATSQNELYVQPLALSMGTTSRSTGTYQAQRGINFGCAPAFIRVYSRLAGYILLVNKSSAAANADVPYGGNVFKIAADSTIQIDMSGTGESFTSGCQVVLSSTPEVVTLPGTSDLLVTIIGN